MDSKVLVPESTQDSFLMKKADETLTDLMIICREDPIRVVALIAEGYKELNSKIEQLSKIVSQQHTNTTFIFRALEEIAGTEKLTELATAFTTKAGEDHE